MVNAIKNGWQTHSIHTHTHTNTLDAGDVLNGDPENAELSKDPPVPQDTLAAKAGGQK